MHFAIAARFRDPSRLLIGGSGGGRRSGWRRAISITSSSRPSGTARQDGGIGALCGEVSRDPSTLKTSMLLTVVSPIEFHRRHGSRSHAERIGSGSRTGSRKAIRANVVDVGVDAVIINLPSYSPGFHPKTREALRPVVGL